MADYPLLVLPAPEHHDTRGVAGTSVPGPLHRPSRGRQLQRIGPRLDALAQQFARQAVVLRTDATGIEPEAVVVLDIAGTVEGFANAVARAGLEWLGEIADDELAPDEDFFAEDSHGQPTQRPIPRRLFFVFSNQTAFRQMLNLWQTWAAGQKLPRNFGRWGDVFLQLRDVRPWGIQDRLIETGILAEWNDMLQYGGSCRCEIELWHRQSGARREAAFLEVERLIGSLGGQVSARCSIPDIAYHALVTELPRAAAQAIVEAQGEQIALVQCEDIQVIRPTAQIVLPGEDSEDGVPIEPPPPGKLRPPVAALFDGLPLQNHRALEGRLRIDDPDGYEDNYPARKRSHGTAMASIMLHGDCNGETIGRELYVRPILKPHPWASGESVPDDQLVVDLIHRAVSRMKDGEAGEGAAAPGVCVINLSIGDTARPFHTALSPFARLLDWLSWKHRVLFVVSSGNHVEPLRIEMAKGEFQQLSAREQRDHLLSAVAGSGRLRRLLSPAEAVNILTVGAMNDDSSEPAPPVGHIDPVGPCTLPSPITTIGLGYRRSIKPDLLAMGGRCPVSVEDDDDGATLLRPYLGQQAPGVRAAAPSPRPGDVTRAVHVRGTSVACAWTTHWATRLHDMLEDLRRDHAGVIDSIPRALWLKALLVHATSWQEGFEALQCLKDPQNPAKFRETSARFLGYGGLNPARAAGCAAHRATALGCGVIAKDTSRTHRLPLPPSLAGVREWKRLTATLAWFTPVSPLHQKWKQADLWFEAAVDPLKVSRNGADHRAVKRGTVQHEIFDGSDAAVFVDGDSVSIVVNCKEGASRLVVDIPYALAVSIEVGEGVRIPIYDEVRTRIRPAVRVQPAP